MGVKRRVGCLESVERLSEGRATAFDKRVLIRARSHCAIVFISAGLISHRLISK